MDWLQLVSLSGWLVLMLAVFASYRLEWRTTVRYALIWIAIFVGMALLFAWLGGWRA